MNAAKILISMPMRQGDPTTYTFAWAQKAAQIARDMGYDVRTIEKENTTFENISKAIKEFNPDLFMHAGHGCPSALQGQTECVLTRKFDAHEIMKMLDDCVLEKNYKKIAAIQKMFNPLGGISCPGICKLDNDICSPLCPHGTNVNLLKDKMVYAVACYSAAQLGECAIKYGVASYLGYDELFMFPVDTLGSQDIFQDIQLEFFKGLLLGKNIVEAEQDMIKLEDKYIRQFVNVKYIALPILWNRIHRRNLGNKNKTIYSKFV